MKERRRSSEPEYLIAPLVDADGVQLTSAIGVDGREYPDPVPLSPPVGYEPPSTLEALIESVIRRRDFQRVVDAAGFETPEEADDFDVDEDYDPRFEETIYEMYFEAKSKRAAAKAAQSATADQRASVGSVSGSSVETRVETPKSVSDDGKRDSTVSKTVVESQPVDRSSGK